MNAAGVNKTAEGGGTKEFVEYLRNDAEGILARAVHRHRLQNSPSLESPLPPPQVKVGGVQINLPPLQAPLESVPVLVVPQAPVPAGLPEISQSGTPGTEAGQPSPVSVNFWDFWEAPTQTKAPPPPPIEVPVLSAPPAPPTAVDPAPALPQEKVPGIPPAAAQTGAPKTEAAFNFWDFWEGGR